MKPVIRRILRNTLASVSLGASVFYPSAHAQWFSWEVSAEGNSHVYRPVAGFAGLTWTMADQLAHEAGGYLATPTSPEENAFVFGLVDAPQFWTALNGSDPAFGGFQQEGDPEPAGGWQWVTGEPWIYYNWVSGQPDNYPGGPPEDRPHFWGGGPRAATWNDIAREDMNLGGFVIEREDIPRPLLFIHPGEDLCWTTVINKQYQLQRAASADSTNWTGLGSVVVATGSTVCTSAPATDQQQRFYRVQMLP